MLDHNWRLASSCVDCHYFRVEALLGDKHTDFFFFLMSINLISKVVHLLSTVALGLRSCMLWNGGGGISVIFNVLK